MKGENEMEFVVNKRDFVKGLGRVRSVADAESALPILSNVLITAESSGIVRLAATNLSTAIETSVRAEVKRGGSVALSAHRAFEVVKALPDGEITVSVARLPIAGKGLSELRNGRASFILPSQPVDDFPILPDADKIPLTQIPVDDLAELIGLTSFSMSSDDTRPRLAAALVEMTGDTLRMVTTDGHRLSKAERTVAGMNGQSKLLIPAGGIRALEHVVGRMRMERPRSIGVGVGAVSAISPEGWVFFQRDGTTLSSKLVGGVFPSYEDTIPVTTSRSAEMNRLAFLDALRAVSVVALDRHSTVKLEIANGRCVVSSETYDIGSGRRELDASLQGPEITIGFNSKYLIDVLNALGSDECALDLSGETDPVIVRGVWRSDFIAVVMPVRLEGKDG